jgi:hypothetical protein
MVRKGAAGRAAEESKRRGIIRVSNNKALLMGM